ncbi:restriction endonuclease subunit S domain-containing protein [Yersinia mollaretii]|uniref:restriction endonuclease subunit S n=1 Tax=Yersinia mollaretii TaxID=33060 RepID=UPI0005DB6D00|nr:restriction endonuclease subunit S [Yersinia mollaretii]CQH10368.1 Type I restriction enzyme EcoKI specificity protein [Yersinia mollaretii]
MSWAPKSLGEILEQSGRDRAGEQDLPVLSITMRHGLVDQAEKFKKRVASSDTSNYRIAYKNELVVGFPIDEGVLGFQTKYPAGIVSPAYNIWKLQSEENCHIPYLERYLRSPQARSSYASRMQGAVARRRSLTKTDFLNLEIPFPTLDDQIRIAHLLGNVEGLIAQRKQGLQQIDELIKSVFLEMFGDPVINENGWDKPEFLAIISSMRNGLSPSKAGAYKGRVYTLSAITGDSFREIYKEDIFSQIHQKYFPTPNDFLLCRGNGNLSLVGKGYFFPSVSTDVIFPDTIIAVSIHPDAINRAFFETLWKTKFIRQQIENNARTTNGAHKVNQGVIENIKIIQPPIELQNQFAAIVKKVDSIRSLYQQSLTDLECLYGALSQQAFNGELDLARVPMPKLPTQDVIAVSQGDQATMPAPVVQTAPAIHLPDTDSQLIALENAEARKSLIADWLEAYCSQLADASFSVQHFMALAQNRLADIHPDNDFVLGSSDYEYIKAWVFEAIVAGTLTQVFDDAGNRIELKAAIEQSPT